MYKTTTLQFDGRDITAAVEQAYGQMLTEAEGYIINCRNFIPNILGYENGVQRYTKFNAVRKRLFNEHNITTYPTACGVGARDNMFTLIYTTADTPATFFNNPNQINPDSYPLAYGGPLFSRAGIHDGNLLISGTASIVGSETLFPFDIVRQTLQTLTNIRTLVDNARKIYPELEYYPSLKYFTYVKNEEDIPTVEGFLSLQGFVSEKVVVNDICRDDLLVEIEAYSPNVL